MSRTSRRVSRPLIGVLAVVIVLGAVFTVHKVRKSHAQVAAKAAPIAVANAPTPAPAIPVAKPQQPAAPKTTAASTPSSMPGPVASAPAGPTPAPESVALVTQTPVEKVSSRDSSSALKSDASSTGSPETSAEPVVPSAPITATPATTTPPPIATTTVSTDTTTAASNESTTSESDAASLQEWAKGAGKTTAAGSVATPGAIASVSHDGSAPANLSPQSISDAKAKLDAGDLIAARQILNDNLIAGRGDVDALKQQIEQINQTLIFSPKKFPDDPWGGSYQVAGGERLGSIASRSSVTWELLARINNVTPRKLRQGQWIKVIKGPFYAVVTKHTFKVDLYLGAPGGPGSMFIRTFMVGLGKDNSTPTGLWMCKAGDKIRNPRYYPSRGGDIIAPDDPKNPLGDYWIAIEGQDGQAVGKESYGIHGTIEPDSIGKMSSQGCIRLRSEDISWVFDMLVDGKSKVVVKD